MEKLLRLSTLLAVLLAGCAGTDSYRIAALTGDKGWTIRIELTSLTDSGGAVSQVGVAVDDKGDVFKITV
jgi:hypothetical protein